MESHLDGAGRSPHVHKVLPLQNGSEAALEHDDPPQHLLMQERLEALALHLPQEHLHPEGRMSATFNPTKPCRLVTRTYLCVAHLIACGRDVDPPEELPDS